MAKFQRKAEALEYAEENETECLMAREIDVNIYEFWCFDNYRAFHKYAIKNVDSLGLFWHEELPANEPRVPFFDIDLPGTDVVFEQEKTERRIARAIGRQCEFIWTNFSRPGKTSFHGICLSEVSDGVYFGFNDKTAQKEFNLSIADNIPGIDVGCVYRIRCIGNAKREIVEDVPWNLDAFRNGKSSFIGSYNVCVSEVAAGKAAAPVSPKNTGVNRAFERFAIEKFKRAHWDKDMQLMRLEILECPLCNRTHDREQLYLKVGARNRVFLNCFRYAGRGQFIGSFKDVDKKVDGR